MLLWIDDAGRHRYVTVSDARIKQLDVRKRGGRATARNARPTKVASVASSGCSFAFALARVGENLLGR